jgi:predicted kinase
LGISSDGQARGAFDLRLDGAGKTTYAISLADRLDGVRFSIDEWMVTLFAADMPQPLNPAWIWERVERCERQIGSMAFQVAARGATAILDLGFQRSGHRRATAAHFRNAGLGVQLHWLDVDAPERWRRVEARNAAKGESFSLTVTRQMFDFFEGRYEPPAAAELLSLDGFRVDLPQ